MQTYILTIGLDEYTVEADWAQAGSPILLDGNSTPFQVADFQHCPFQTAEGIVNWLGEEGDYEFEEKECFDSVYDD